MSLFQKSVEKKYLNDSIIERQIRILQVILSDIAEKDKNGSEDFIIFIQKYFGFDTEFGWNILMNAFYVFEDTELAKHDFEIFGLQGPNRHENTGEKYLRLYGILNSISQQYLAIINLMELFKLEEKQSYKEQLKQSTCIELRNKIASHSTNYSTDRTNKNFDVYEISRAEMENENICLLKNQEYFEKYDLTRSINDFNILLHGILSKILEKFLKKKFNNQGKHYVEFQKLEKLRNGAIQLGNQIIEFKE